MNCLYEIAHIFKKSVQDPEIVVQIYSDIPQWKRAKIKSFVAENVRLSIL